MTIAQITPQSSIATLLAQWPQAVPVFLKHHMSCPGCSMSAFETLEDASKIYQLDVNQLITEINATVQAKTAEEPAAQKPAALKTAAQEQAVNKPLADTPTAKLPVPDKPVAQATEITILVETTPLSIPLSEETTMTEAYTFFEDIRTAIDTIPTDSIVSRTVFRDDSLKSIVFAFAPGQELSEHTASVPAIIHILEGECELTLGSDSYSVAAGAWARLPANLPHSVLARTPVRMLLLMLSK